MAKIDPDVLKAMLSAARSDALAAISASKLSDERASAMDYYLGDMSKDMPAPEGRSSAVSTDVSDTIDGMMPGLVEIFAGSDEVVRFEPVGPEDVQAAEQETDYVNHVFMQENPGFMVLYSFIKDALLQKVGIVKVWWEETEQEERETYLGQPEDAFMLIAQAAVEGDFEIAEHTPNEDGTHDITIVSTKKTQQARVMGVPPEEFGIERGARDIKTCNYCFHETNKSVGELEAQGYDRKQLDAIATANDLDTESQSRDTVDEQDPVADTLNATARMVRVTEHYIRMDYENKGTTCIYRVTTAGEGGEILKRGGQLDIEQTDVYPFAAVTPVPITHRFFGRSIADLVMDVQRIKTALVRGALDNLYLHNNPRVEVPESHAGPNTLDDLLVSRPGGVVRTKTAGGLQWQIVPDITASVYPALQYMDSTREWRTGVTRQSQGIDADALQNQTATAANQQFQAATARLKMVARIIAETGIRDMFALLHQTIRKHGSQAKTVRLRNQWVTVDPRNWKTRQDMTISVGLGTGGKQERAAMLTLLLNIQKECIAGGLPIATPKNVFNTVKELGKVIDLKDITPYMTDPDSPEGQQAAQAAAQRPDPKMVELQMKREDMQAKGQLDQQQMVMKAEIEKLQAQADIATQDRKTQAEIAMAERKFELERELKLLDVEINREKARVDIQLKTVDHQNKQQERAAKAEEAKTPKASIEVKHGAEEITGPLSEIIGKIGETQDKQMQALMAVVENSNRPRKKKVTGPKGQTYQIEEA